MPTFGFTLTPESVVRVHDAILCLAKFNETVGLEARRNEVGYSEDLGLTIMLTDSCS